MEQLLESCDVVVIAQKADKDAIARFEASGLPMIDLTRLDVNVQQPEPAMA